MRNRVVVYRHLRPRRRASRDTRRRWMWFIGLSTGLLLGLAVAIRLWLPVAAPLASALVLFALIHATFLSVQKAGADPQG